MLNGGVLNGGVLNGALEDAPPDLIGEGLLISFEQQVAVGEQGLLVSFEQVTGAIGDGLLISFEQDVRLEISGGGLLISFEQSVEATGSGLLISFEQRVIDYSPSPTPIPILPHIQRTDWDAVIMLAGNEVPEEMIHGGIHIERTEGGASVCNFTLCYKPGAGVQNVETLAGKPVTIDFQTPEGTFRVYTGVVDIPEIDLIEKKITINCTDRRLELINAQLGPLLPTIGYYSSIIFSEPKDVAEELDQRLSTIPYSVDFDAFGTFNFTAKRAKLTPDFILGEGTVYDREPTVSYTSRDRIVNKVNISFQYRFPRLHHMQRTFNWVSPIRDNICLMLQQGYTLAQKTMIAAAAYSAGWVVRDDISYTAIHPGGWYNCGGGPIGWSTTVLTGTTTYKTDSSGDYLLDSSGEKIAETRITGGTNFFPMFANGASWAATTRWAQTITENYTLTVQAPQSISLYGAVETDNSYSSEDETDASNWEDYTSYDNPFNQGALTYHIDAAAGRSAMNGAVITALNIAKTTILNSHRDTRVSINRFLWPRIDLKHTVEIDTGILKARGKVVNIIHDINNTTTEAYTTVVIALSRAVGSQADSSFTVPAVPTDTVDPGTGVIELGNHYGEDPEQDGAETWTGRVGNKRVGFYMTDYPEQFIVRTPAIPDAVRDEKQKYISAGYNVSIPNDLLEVTF